MNPELPTNANVVIIGAGITGACTAWNMARRSAGKVIVIDSGPVAAGPSGRTGALLRRHYSNPWEGKMAQLGWETFSNWDEVVGVGESGFVPYGLIVTVSVGEGCEANSGFLDANIALQNSLGVDSRRLTPAELRELQPFVVVDEDAGIAYEHNSGCVDGTLATRSMFRAAQDLGVQLFEGCPITGVRIVDSRVSGVETSRGFVSAPVVVIAAGPWSGKLAATAGVELPIEPIRVQIAVVHRPSSLEEPPFIFVDTEAGMFTRPMLPGRSLVGVGVGSEHDPVDPDNYDHRADADYPTTAIAAVSKRFPLMADASLAYALSCLYDMTPDAHAIIGPAGPEGLFVAAGFSGAGFKKGPAVGLCLTELILDGQATTVDLSKFSLDRFASDAWQQPWSDTEYIFTSDFGHRL